MGTPLLRFMFYPMDQLKLLGSSMRQMVGKKFDPEKDIIDQSSKVILITGGESATPIYSFNTSTQPLYTHELMRTPVGNTGLGKETVFQLAKHNPTRIYLAARNTAKAQAAIADIQKHLSQPADIHHLPLDLSSFASIRAAADQFTSSNNRLDTLILNAGIMDILPHRTKDGYEMDFGTNHLGHFLLTTLLLPTLVNTAKKLESEGKPPDNWRVDTQS
ncbi:predicted protein [Uncinocarpus reesii 1704]|uniref:Oxidoreductase n=1 Tax=Uncinocarpus reesii (strain UAMH 1704) TaxID=336963 RepID=C4JU53_UNCRE|nr:uncharacterized protein UREG_05992 [Uncinocarpus reesii 1704]EEP81150.1 predicted protein [Uncinocarpus reesii 1704]